MVITGTYSQTCVQRPPSKQWPLLTDGRCSKVIYILEVQNSSGEQPKLKFCRNRNLPKFRLLSGYFIKNLRIETESNHVMHRMIK